MEVAAPPLLNGLNARAGVVSKFKPVQFTAIFVLFFLQATKAGVDAAPDARGTAGVALAPVECPPKIKTDMAKSASLVCVFVSPNTTAGAASVIEAGDFATLAVNKTPGITGANAGKGIDNELPSIVSNAHMVFFFPNVEAFPSCLVTAAPGS